MCNTYLKTAALISMTPTEAQYSNATAPVQGQYSSGKTQNFRMDLLHNG